MLVNHAERTPRPPSSTSNHPSTHHRHRGHHHHCVASSSRQGLRRTVWEYHREVSITLADRGLRKGGVLDRRAFRALLRCARLACLLACLLGCA